MEMLSEHRVQGWLEGYLRLAGTASSRATRPSSTSSTSMFNQHAKWLKVCNPWPAAPAHRLAQLPAFQPCLAPGPQRLQPPGSGVHRSRRQQEGGVRPGLPAAVANCSSRPTTACAAAFTAVAWWQLAPQWLTMEQAIKHCTAGLGIWEWASNDQGDEPDVVMACCGDVPTLETLAAVDLLHRYAPDTKVRVINVVNLEAAAGERASAWTLGRTSTRSSRDKPIIFAFHGYPWLIHRLTWRHGHPNLHVRGYKEEGPPARLRHVRDERPRPLPPGGRRDRPRSEARSARRPMPSRRSATSSSSTSEYRPIRRRHAGSRGLDVGAVASDRRITLDGGRQRLSRGGPDVSVYG